MTGKDVFYETFSDYWFEFKHPNRVNPSWIKVIDFSPMYECDVGSNIRIISVYNGSKIGPRKKPIDSISNILHATENLSYYKLFRNCTVVADKEKLAELIFIEAKLRLL